MKKLFLLFFTAIPAFGQVNYTNINKATAAPNLGTDTVLGTTNGTTVRQIPLQYLVVDGSNVSGTISVAQGGPNIHSLVTGSVPPVVGNTIRYLFPGGGLVSATETNVVMRMPFSCTVTNLQIQYGSVGASTNVIMTVDKNGTATAVTLTFNGTGNPGFTNDTHGVAFAVGDALDISIVGNNSSAMANTINFNWSFQIY